MNKTLILVILGVCSAVALTMAGHSTGKANSEATIQQIFDEDAGMKTLNVHSIHEPILSGLPGYAMLSQMGLFSRKVTGSFMISRKDGRELSANCKFADFDFDKAFNEANFYVSISGIEAFKVRMCATGT